ncbi:MAG TPA: hypothetical protein VE871_19370 [Longimicrobium sp.]|nr:hypothetical protein [Longimicrobium sp.]
MKKLRMEIDALRVESFGTGTGSAGGTVNGHFDNVADPVIVTDPATDRSRIDSCYFNTCYETCDWGGNAVQRPQPVDRSRVDSCYFNTCYDTCDWTA